MADDFLTIDDRASGDTRSNLGTVWRLVSDTVMGGVSQGQLAVDHVHGRSCLHVTGTVRMENNGGFVQASLDLGKTMLLDASSYLGFELDVNGNGEIYNLHIRTTDTTLVWQSYRAHFQALSRWQTVQLPFANFQAHRISIPLDLRCLKRVGLVAIGRAFTADFCIARLGLYRQPQAGQLSG